MDLEKLCKSVNTRRAIQCQFNFVSNCHQWIMYTLFITINIEWLQNEISQIKIKTFFSQPEWISYLVCSKVNFVCEPTFLNLKLQICSNFEWSVYVLSPQSYTDSFFFLLNFSWFSRSQQLIPMLWYGQR